MDPNEEKMFRTLCKGIEALNVNLTDVARSLRVLAESDGKEKEFDRWRSAIGPEAELPGDDYDWVLVKIRDSFIHLPGSSSGVYNIPHIAEYRNGKWWSQEWDKPYETVEVPFEVIGWRPIPGDKVEKSYTDTDEIIRGHRYE